ncbi:hypothetical protein Hrubri_2298 [Herbaspirillum rubrisubalbicans M1]|uniref:hypothetical protein n=1 Tax=Herbaspirillum rubrisubalbicans TaxID=80842 RepID=UPI00073A2931|nr:hypothetical protein [Herbaspirillum rubrisubalbicans]ALU89484.1 hypothetical protein Hrubri_2298 [Herbaspirillum rubrisubalbicans M1]
MTKGKRRKTRHLLIDTNLWLVMIIGGVDEGRYISKSKRLGSYCLKDYDNLWKIVASYDEVWITPYIAAEVSNLIDLDGEAGTKAYLLARTIFSNLKQVESSISKDCENEFYVSFGLTDGSIIELANKFDVLTNDQRMFGPLFKIGGDNVKLYFPVNLR